MIDSTIENTEEETSDYRLYTENVENGRVNISLQRLYIVTEYNELGVPIGVTSEWRKVPVGEHKYNELEVQSFKITYKGHKIDYEEYQTIKGYDQEDLRRQKFLYFLLNDKFGFMKKDEMEYLILFLDDLIRINPDKIEIVIPPYNIFRWSQWVWSI